MKGGKSAPRKPLSREGGYLITELHFRNIKWTRAMGTMSTVEMQIAERSRNIPSAGEVLDLGIMVDEMRYHIYQLAKP